MGHAIYLTVETLLLVTCFFVNEYSKRRMGLNRHLIYERFRFEQWVEDKPFEWIILLFIVCIILALLFAYRQKKRKGKWSKCHIFLAIALLVFLIYISFIPDGKTVMLAPYLYILIPVILIGNVIGIWFSS